MSKAGTTYWNKYPAERAALKNGRASGAGRSGATLTRWMALLVIFGTMSVLCMAVNFRAFMEVNRQSLEHQRLSTEAEQLNSKNIVLQEEIKNLKGDPKTIEKEARKIGMSRPNEKILVPMN